MLLEGSEGATRASEKTHRPARKIRFVDPTESDIYVYEPSPSSPKRPIGLLLPAPESLHDRENIRTLKYSLNKLNTFPTDDAVTQADDDSPEAIRAKFFPSETPPEDNPSLAWMMPQPVSIDQILSEGSTSIRYSLSGTPLSPSEIRSLPTHLGLHHHASTSSAFSSDTPAGYTIEDLLQLSRSSAPPQRVSILGVLGKIFQNTYTAVFTSEAIPMRDVHRSVDLSALRRDIFDSAVEAVAERGWVGQRAVDVLWEIIVGCTQVEMHLGGLDKFPCVDLTPPSNATKGNSACKHERSFLLSRESATFLAMLPVQRLLSPLKSHLSSNSSVSTTYDAILDILFVLCHFEKHAKSLVDPNTNSEIVRAILESHLSPTICDTDNPPNRKSIRILQALARSSREVAQHLLGPADILLRYVTTMQDELDFNEIHASMLRDTLSFYVSLMRYGFYTSVFSNIHTYFTHLLLKLHEHLPNDIIGVTSVLSTLLDLLETAIICATNPHQTTPPHGITWSQIEAFNWIDHIFELLNTLVELSVDGVVSEEIQLLWTRVFHVLAAWTEGAHVNGIRNGEKEKGRLVLSLKSQILGGSLGILLRRKLELLKISFGSQTDLTNSDIKSLVSHLELINTYLRLSLASMSPDDHLPYDLFLTNLCDISRLVIEGAATFEIFRIITAENLHRNLSEDLHLSVRHLSTLLFLVLRIRCLTPDASETSPSWIIDALRILHTFLPGDEYFAQWVVQRLCLTTDRDVTAQRLLEKVNNRSQQNLTMLSPFWSGTFIPRTVGDDLEKERHYYPNFWPKSEEMPRITSLHLPSLSTLRQRWSQQDCASIFPLRSTWVFWPVDHLLRSGTSNVLKYLPSSWDATELEVVQGTLGLTLAIQCINKNYPSNLTSLGTLNRAETIFACMKVFMLEQDQGQLETGEIYRNPLVEKFLRNLLLPFAFRNASKERVPTDFTSDSLELASESYLGKKTPFYQFYTDFLALYDSISFGHHLFAKLLLPPISLSYLPDYRNLFFGEYGHVLRTIDIDPEDVLSSDIKEYLWPIERNSQILGLYLNVLFKYPLRGFLRWFVIHHLAANIWPDLVPEDFSSTRSTELLKAILAQDKGRTPHTRDILFYHQTREDTILPPQCYNRDSDLLKLRTYVLDKCSVSLEGTLENLSL